MYAWGKGAPASVAVSRPSVARVAVRCARPGLLIQAERTGGKIQETNRPVQYCVTTAAPAMSPRAQRPRSLSFNVELARNAFARPMSYVAPYEYRVTVPVRTSTHDQHPLPAPHLQPPTSAEVRSGQCLLLTYLLCLLACLLACGSLAGCATMTRYLITVFLPVSIRFRERSAKKRSGRAQRGLDRRPPFHSRSARQRRGAVDTCRAA